MSPKNGGRPRKLDPSSETLMTCLAEKSLRSLLSVPCVIFGCENNTSTSKSDCVYIKRICASSPTVHRGCVGLMRSETEKQDAFHHKQLRSITRIHWPQRISNVKLYERCRCRQISTDVMDMNRPPQHL